MYQYMQNGKPSNPTILRKETNQKLFQMLSDDGDGNT